MKATDYDLFAEEFSKTRQQPWKEVIEFLDALPKNCEDPKTCRPEDRIVLDIGCGNGRHLIEAEKRGLSAVGIDISRNLLKIAKRKTNSSLILGNALALPFKDGAFDNSICIAVVHHFGTEGSQKLAERHHFGTEGSQKLAERHDFKTEKERINCLREIARVTKNSSLVSVWAFEQEKFAKRKTQDIRLGWDKKFPRFYHLFKEGEIEGLIKRAGLKIKKSWRAGNNYWVVLER